MLSLRISCRRYRPDCHRGPLPSPPTMVESEVERESQDEEVGEEGDGERMQLGEEGGEKENGAPERDGDEPGEVSGDMLGEDGRESGGEGDGAEQGEGR